MSLVVPLNICVQVYICTYGNKFNFHTKRHLFYLWTLSNPSQPKRPKFIIKLLTCLQVSWWQPTCPAPGHPHSVSSASAHGALVLVEVASPGLWVDCSGSPQHQHRPLNHDPPAWPVPWLPSMSHDDDLLNHYLLCTRSCFPWFQRWRPQTRGSPKTEGGSLRWKNRAEPVQGSCRHKKWSRWLLSYHLQILDLGDCYPSGLGVICKNIHTVATESCGFSLRKERMEDEPKIWSTQTAVSITEDSRVWSDVVQGSQHCAIKRAKTKTNCKQRHKYIIEQQSAVVPVKAG